MVVEHPFIQVQHFLPAGGRRRVGVRVQRGGQLPSVPEAVIEVKPAVLVPHQDRHRARDTPLQMAGQPGRGPDGLGRDPVLLQERRQLPIGVQQVTVLVGPVQGAGSKRIQQRQGLVDVQRPRAEHRHLALQHLGQAS
jgi:hypothetical protein